MTTSAVLFVVGFLALFGLWVVGMGLAWHRIDTLDKANRDLERHLARANADFDHAAEKANEAADHARDWAAIADERAVELSNHMARCLGELVHNDSGVVR